MTIPHVIPWLCVDSVRTQPDEGHGMKLVGANDLLEPDGTLPHWLLIEALSQVAAAVMIARQKEGMGATDADARDPSREETHRGYLVEIRDFHFYGRASVGSQIGLSVRHTHSLGHIHRFTTCATIGETVLARGELTFAVEGGRQAFAHHGGT